MNVRRLGAMVALGVWLATSGAVWAAAPPKTSLELLVLIPSHHHLAVFEQVELARPTTDPTIGLLQGYSSLAGINVALKNPTATTAAVVGTVSEIAVKYTLPWNGTSLLLQEVAPEATAAVVIMVPMSLTLPSVVNPIWSPSKARKIPGLPNSPLFRVFSTGNLRAGQNFGASLENTASVVAPPLPREGYPLAGRAAEFLFGLLVLGALLLAINWKPLRGAAGGGARDRLLGRLAVLDAQFRRGELDAADYRRERESLFHDAERVWN